MPKSVEIINREHWLEELASRLAPMFKEVGRTVPKYRVSCSFPASCARSETRMHIGECHYGQATEDGVHQLMIHPILADEVAVAETLVHEILHTTFAPGIGHKAPFAKACVALGLEGKPTATEANESLKARLKEITDELGPYPHSRLGGEGRKKQKTYLLSIKCPICKYVLQVTQKWLDEAGFPQCPQCQIEFVFKGEDDIENPLITAEQAYKFRLKDDERFVLHFTKNGVKSRWYILDYGEPEIDKFGKVSTLLGANVMPRVTPAEGRQDALDLIESIKLGMVTYAELETDPDDDYFDDDSDWESIRADELDDFLSADEIEDLDNDEEASPVDEYPALAEAEPVEVL